jgi:rhodanese-related sulfurtransferase
MSWWRRWFGPRPEPPPVAPPRPAPVSVQPEQAAALIRDEPHLVLLDVRSEPEHRDRHIPGSRLIPLPELPDRMAELDPSRPLLVYCEHGMRSSGACALLAEAGFARLYDLAGGMSEWEARVRS